jgi:hypothetical protein
VRCPSRACALLHQEKPAIFFLAIVPEFIAGKKAELTVTLTSANLWLTGVMTRQVVVFFLNSRLEHAHSFYFHAIDHTGVTLRGRFLENVEENVL